MPHQQTTIPDDRLELSKQLEHWRSAHRLPESFRAAAVEMAQRHGPHRTAKALGIDYTRLKKRSRAPPAIPETPAAAVWRDRRVPPVPPIG